MALQVLTTSSSQNPSFELANEPQRRTGKFAGDSSAAELGVSDLRHRARLAVVSTSPCVHSLRLVYLDV
ncbi:hypothetical protein GSI_05023 [Ganoderma sinense ZZ0214-1]|uniref:Uncharacterized protein n=1 Tax=Ganoderma sinense ZZ0214-1 TaxID=1077348 RepID=A0A2G8SGJ4_9APHY|nr:hypothetical protein GSI_05023 [Ganoderma sinense ZZ0214-1]